MACSQAAMTTCSFCHFRRGSRLKISKTQTEDDGVYECVADNALGTARKNVTVEGIVIVVVFTVYADWLIQSGMLFVIH